MVKDVAVIGRCDSSRLRGREGNSGLPGFRAASRILRSLAVLFPADSPSAVPAPSSPAWERSRPGRGPTSHFFVEEGARPGLLVAGRAPPQPSLGPPIRLAALPHRAVGHGSQRLPGCGPCRLSSKGRHQRVPRRRLHTGCCAGHPAAPLRVRCGSHP